ncbi:MAG: hypothetical protein E7239_05225 [Sarcina sp.]|nr:hypothetical protein [Sarcina sp.]
MPSFKKINSEQNHKEETSQNNTAINKAGQKTIGRIKTGQNKAGRGISGKAVRKSGKAVPSSPEKKGVHGPSFFIPLLSAALAVLLFLAGSSLVLSRSRSVFEPGIQDPAGHSSTLNSSADSASPGSASPDSASPDSTSPGNTSPGSASSRRTSSDSASTESASAESASPESLRSWLGVDTVLEILSPEPAEISQPSESQALSSAEDSSAVPALSASPAGEAPVSSFSFVSSAVEEENTAENNSLSADPVSTADSPAMAASPESAAASTRADASEKADSDEKSDKKTNRKSDGKSDNKEDKTDAEQSSGKNDKEKGKENKEDKGNKGDEDSGNKEQNANNKNSKNDKGDSDSKASLTKKQKEYVRDWEELHGYDFPMQTTLHDYNWDYLEYDEMWNLYYKGDKKYKIRRGIDVSEFQGEIDWDEVKKAGYDFVFVRAGHRMFESGDLITDSRAVKNMRQAKKAGLDVGVYVFSQAVSESEAREEAQLCLDIIKKSGVEITLPVVFDPEIQTEYIARINYISGEQFTDNAVAFCKKIEKAGFTPAIYTNCSTETDILDMSRLDNAVIWYADYGIIPESPYRFTFWQYSNTGWVEGIPEGMTDLNVWFVEREEK